MLNLKRKLDRLGAPRAAPRPAAIELDPARAERLARIEALRAEMSRIQTSDRVALRGAQARPPDDVPLPGTLEETALGPLHRIDRYLEPAHCHGHTPIAGALSVSAEAIAALALDADLAGIDLRGMLLLDTETTGLSGGTGTLPFLIGMAFFEDESLRLEQLVLRRPGEEGPMLARLAERVRAASCIVTYNGKSFDWPLLRTRAVLNRTPLSAPAAHLDLLHCARRIFAPRLGSVRLVEIERAVLGLTREDDVEGHEIPALYWDYVRSGRAAALASVIEHNALDLVALAATMVALAERWEGVRAEHEPEDQLAIAKLSFRAAMPERALSFAQSAAGAGGSRKVRAEALVLAARAVRRARMETAPGPPSAEETARITGLLEAALDAAQGEPKRESAIHLALTKHLEHRAKDLDSALHHARYTALVEGNEAAERRTERLARKRERDKS